MKKQFKQIILFIVFIIGTSVLQAQQMPPIHIDGNVRIGKLENGLTYYIRENKLPENRANFYIVQKVGSILEEDNQRGLAHFLEHMAFNGSKNFPAGNDDKSMISYLETIGVKFGANLNAATGMDETIYNINDVPVTTPGAVENCLLILHDWSNALLLREKEIDKERKVIHEEWRTGQNAQKRVFEKIAPTIFKGSKYAYRMPIGIMEVVDNFEPQVLCDYYHKWYRPDLQGIIVVGDINADEIEKQIKTVFSSIAMPENAAERVYEQIPDNETPIVAVATDKEMPMNSILIAYKRNPIPNEGKATMDYLIYDYATQMIGEMLKARLEEMLQKPEAPFAYTTAMNGSFFGVGTKDALQVVGVAKPGSADATIATLMREVKRAKEFGFTEGEFERAKANYLSNLEKLYNEREKQQNSFYVNQYIQHFVKNEPIPSIEDRYNTMNQIVPHIPVAAINQITQQLIGENNRVVVLMGVEKEKDTYPTEDEILKIIKTIDNEQLAAYEDNTVTEPLLGTLPTKGKIVKEETDTTKGTTIWTLGNGAKVIVKATDFKQDEILVNGFALGGSTTIDDKYMAEIKLMDDLATVGGLGKFSTTDLRKNLSGKNADVKFSVAEYNERINGKSSVKDLETLMQLIYLNFTDIRKDGATYQSFVERFKGTLPTLSKNPDFIFADSIMNTMYLNNPRFSIPTVQEIESADYDKILELYSSRFANAGNFTFTFVGNVSPEQLKPLVEQYIASLPGKPTNVKVREVPTRKGVYNNHFTFPLETPKATTAIVYTGDMAYTAENVFLLDVLKQIFQMEFVEKIREEQGGTYGVRVHAKAEKLPKDTYTIQFQFDTNPEMRNGLVERMNEVVADIQKSGPDAQMLDKIKEYMQKEHADNLKENSYTLTNTWQYYVYGVDFEKDYEKRVNELSVSAVKEFAKHLFKQNNRVEVSMSSR